MFIQQCLKKLQMFSLLNKTQSKSLILALFIACSAETTSTVPETTTSSIEPISNTTISEVNEDLALQNFQLAWEETLKEPIVLSDYEKELTAYLFELWKWKGDKSTPEKENFYELKINGLSCYRIWNAMGSAWLDEVHPIQDNYSKGYWAVERYTCEEDSIYGMGPSLFGAPFYYQDTWWIYQKFEFNWNMVDCKSPCGYGNYAFATRVAIDLDDEIYSIVLPRKMTLEEYEKGWSEKLETYPVLTKDEFDKSIEFFISSYQLSRENHPHTELGIIVDSNNYVCERRTTGTIISAYVNEVHPILLYISETGDDENADELRIYEYIVTGDYNCYLENSEEGLFLWGPLFFQDNQWWGFIEYEDDYWEQSGEPDVLIQSFAKRISLGVSIND